jgi:hypothetical protein
MLRAAFVLAALAITAGPASAQYYGSPGYGGNTYRGYQAPSYGGYGTGANPQGHYVQPHTRSDGRTTGGHYQSNPNNTTLDNWSTRGNTNPYTGQPGTRAPRW